MKIVILSILFSLISPWLLAQGNDLFQKQQASPETGNLPYRIMYPKDYDKNKTYPLILFLHGAGERGDDNEKQLKHGSSFFIKNNQSDFPAIVIAPQCPANSFWATFEGRTKEGKYIFAKDPNPSMKGLMKLVDYWLNSGKVDKSRVYVGGLSMGGMGTFEILQRMPNTFIAAFPICGGGDIKGMKEYAKNTAVWIFHGAKDDIVPVERSRESYEALKEAGCEVKYTEYPDDKHESWNSVFKDTELMPWLFKHKKKS